MQEDFLHYVWKFKKYAFAKAHTTLNFPITLVQVGHHNTLAGPDFFNAKLHIADQLWAGNVEIHLKSSDWYAHRHEDDPAYENVILHVVWEHDVNVFRKDNTPIPTLELKNFVSKEALHNYQELFANQKSKWINCEQDLSQVPKYVQDNWLERLYFERLGRKTERIKDILKSSNNDWEATLFTMLARNFGTKINGDSFETIAQSLDFSVIRKCANEPFRLESLLFGLGGLLPDDSTDSYALQLETEYEFQKHKHSLNENGVLPVQFFKLRPDNFPTIRLSQLAQLYFTHLNLFQKLMRTDSVTAMYDLFAVQASPYWDTHFSFGTQQKKRAKKLTKSFIDLIIINTIIPLRFYYSQHQGKDENELILEMIQTIKPEQNTIIKKFNTLRPKAQNAQETQALIELKSNYCDPNHCLQCGIGNWLLGK